MGEDLAEDEEAGPLSTRATNPMTDKDFADVEAKFDTIPENEHDDYGKFLKEVYTGRNAQAEYEDEDEEFVCKDDDEEEDPEEYLDDEATDVAKEELAGLMEDLQMVADPRLRKLIKKKPMNLSGKAEDVKNDKVTENGDMEDKENKENVAA